MPPVSPALSRLTIPAFAVWLIGLSVLPPSATRIDTWPVAGWLLAGWIAFIAFAWFRGSTVRLGGGRDLGLLAFAGVTIASAWASPWRGGSLAAALGVAAGIALLYGLVREFRGGRKAQGNIAFDFAAVAVVAAGLLFWIWPALSTGFAAGSRLALRNDYPFGHVNYTAGAALLATSWLAAGAFAHRERARGWRAGGALLAAALLVSSGSRAGVVALMGGIGLVLLALWIQRGRRRRDATIGIGVMLLVAVVGVSTNERLRVFVTEGRWSEPAATSNTQRQALAAAAIELGGSHGLLGPGPGTVPLTYPEIAGRSPRVGAPDATLQVHSAPLQVWATTGPAGAGALLVLVATLIPVLIRPFRATASMPESVLAAGALAYGSFALTDHQFDVPFIAVLVIAHLARLLAPVAQNIPAPVTISNRRRLVTALIAVALAGPFFQRTRDVAARATFAGALHAYDTNQPVAAQRALVRAGRFAPWDRFYAEAAAAWQWETTPRRSEAASTLRGALTDAAPWPSEFALYNLAWLELELGQPDAAAHFAAAARIAPHRRGVHLGYALARLRTDDAVGAVRALARECLSDPSIVTELWWQEPAMHALIPAVRISIEQQADQLAATLRTGDERTRLQGMATLIAWWLQPDQRTPSGLSDAIGTAVSPALRQLDSAPARGSGPWPGMDRWGSLGSSWAMGQPADSLNARAASELATRLARSVDFTTFVTAPITDAPAWRRAERTLRRGYRVIMRHPDAAVAADVPVFERNLLVAPFAADLFPLRGWIPGGAWHDAGLLP